LDRILAVVPVHNRRVVTLKFLKQLRDLKLGNFKLDVLVVDDGSTDETTEAVRHHFPETIILKGDGTLWWAGGINVGLKYALKHGYDYVYTVNNDIELYTDTLYQLHLSSHRVEKAAVCSSVFYNLNGKIVLAGWKVCGRFKRWRNIAHLPGEESATARCMRIDSLSTKSTLIPICIIRDAGLLDEARFPHHQSDIEYFYRLKKKGYLLIVCHRSKIITAGSDSNYHNIILGYGFRQIIKTFFNIKYANNIKILYRFATIDDTFPIGLAIFFLRLLPFLVWLFLKVALPKNILKQLLIKSGRTDV
jgi:GT2 family glycosyltransferase